VVGKGGGPVPKVGRGKLSRKMAVVGKADEPVASFRDCGDYWPAAKVARVGRGRGHLLSFLASSSGTMSMICIGHNQPIRRARS
jgi:hypothetical protein